MHENGTVGSDRACRTWEETVEGLVATIRTTTPLPPVPIEEIAALVGIKRVVREPELPFSGRLVPIKGSYVVELNAEEHPVRQRFTLGHEIGHVLLSSCDSGRAGAQYLRCGRDAALEKECDRISARLLLPTQELQSFFHERDVSIELLAEVCHVFSVSWQTLAIRIPELHSTSSFVLWHYAPGGKKGEPAYRVCWSATPDGVWIPPNAKARDEAVIRKSLVEHRIISGSAVLDLGTLRGRFSVGAVPLGREKATVLMMITHTARSRTG